MAENEGKVSGIVIAGIVWVILIIALVAIFLLSEDEPSAPVTETDTQDNSMLTPASTDMTSVDTTSAPINAGPETQTTPSPVPAAIPSPVPAAIPSPVPAAIPAPPKCKRVPLYASFNGKRMDSCLSLQPNCYSLKSDYDSDKYGNKATYTNSGTVGYACSKDSDPSVGKPLYSQWNGTRKDTCVSSQANCYFNKQDFDSDKYGNKATYASQGIIAYLPNDGAAHLYTSWNGNSLDTCASSQLNCYFNKQDFDSDKYGNKATYANQGILGNLYTSAS